MKNLKGGEANIQHPTSNSEQRTANIEGRASCILEEYLSLGEAWTMEAGKPKLKPMLGLTRQWPRKLSPVRLTTSSRVRQHSCHPSAGEP
jgi:hypothetical protein